MLIEPPSALQNAVIATIMRDLAPSPLSVHVRLGLATLSGAALSLAVCGQFGFALTAWGEAMSHELHAAMPPLACALICGVLFAVFPIAVLRLVLASGPLLRTLLTRHQLALASW